MIRKMQKILWSVAGLAICGTVGYGHHSIAGAYDSNQPRTIEGTVTQFQFINPHPFLLIDVMQAGGIAQSWKLEMDNRSELAQIGVTRETFKAGDRVIINGSLSRSQPLSLYIWKLDRPADGLQYEQVGGTPRIRPRR